MQLHKTVGNSGGTFEKCDLAVPCCALEVGEPLTCPASALPCWACRANRRTSAASPAGRRWWSGSEVRRGRSDPGQRRKSRK